ncbi:MAG: PHP domain-containing protein [Longimicrobiales bacterium]
MSAAPDARVDLHLHSTASDGSLDPAALVEAAVAGGLDVIALADHDTTAGVEPALAAAGGRVRIIPALEISASLDGADLHILGYHVDPDDPALSNYARGAAQRRATRAERIVGKLAGLGVALEIGHVARVAGPGAVIGRPHIARALVERGAAGSVGEAFDRWLADDRPAFVPTGLASVAEAVTLIRGAGGVSVWAHPAPGDLTRLIDALIVAGVGGIEVFRPRVDARLVRRTRRLAEARDLLVSGGSDWHGEWHGPLGAFAVPAERIRALLASGPEL